MEAEEGWLAAACAAKGLEPGSTEAGEELFAGVGTFVRMARLFRDALRDIAKDGKPSFAGPVREAYDGRLRVQVFPESPFDRITFPQTTAEVWMQPGVSRESLVAGQAPAYSDPSAHTGTALVLAAGNVASLGPRDVLSKLFVEGKVVVMKANPVNDYLVPHWSRALAPLIDAQRAAHRRRRCRGRSVSHSVIPASTRSTSPGRTRRTTPWCSAPAPRARGAKLPTSRSSTNPSPRSWATCHRSSWCPARGRSPSCATRPSMSPPCWSTTRASTAFRPASSSPMPPGHSATPSSAR